MKTKTNFNFSYSKLKAPCHNCTRRELGCRSKCADWQEYETAKDEEEAKKRLYFAGYFK